jgi:hypothetical protein
MKALMFTAAFGAAALLAASTALAGGGHGHHGHHGHHGGGYGGGWRASVFFGGPAYAPYPVYRPYYAPAYYAPAYYYPAPAYPIYAAPVPVAAAPAAVVPGPAPAGVAPIAAAPVAYGLPVMVPAPVYFAPPPVVSPSFSFSFGGR